MGLIGTFCGSLLGWGAVADASYSPANSEPFLVPTATVVTTSSTQSQFTVSCPTTTNPSFLGQSGGPACKNGQITILVRPDTTYYLLAHKDGSPCPASGGTDCAYHQSNYATIITPGAQLRIGGWYVEENYQNYELTATYIWNPGTDLNSPPPDPGASTPADYAFQHTFVVQGTIVQPGASLPGTHVWSGQTGFVLGDITSYNDNLKVAAIAAAHRNPQTLDPQLGVTTDNPTITNGDAGFDGLTHYYQQQSDGKYAPATKDGVVAIGNEVEVAGSYGWALGDWQFIPWYVWQPAKAIAQPAPFSFNVVAEQASSTSDGNGGYTVSYAGSSDSGDGQMNPSTVTFTNMSWSFVTESDGSQLWEFSGDWSATRSSGPSASFSGTLTGTWDPSTAPYPIQATVALTSATGIYCGDFGGGSYSSTANSSFNPPPAGSAYPWAPPLTFDGQFHLTVNTPATKPAGC